MLLASLTKLICGEGTCTKNSLSAWDLSAPPTPTHTCVHLGLWLGLHYLPPTSSPGIEKATQILPTAETCRDFHHFALVGRQDTP